MSMWLRAAARRELVVLCRGKGIAGVLYIEFRIAVRIGLCIVCRLDIGGAARGMIEMRMPVDCAE